MGDYYLTHGTLTCTANKSGEKVFGRIGNPEGIETRDGVLFPLAFSDSKGNVLKTIINTDTEKAQDGNYNIKVKDIYDATALIDGIIKKIDTETILPENTFSVDLSGCKKEHLDFNLSDTILRYIAQGFFNSPLYSNKEFISAYKDLNPKAFKDIAGSFPQERKEDFIENWTKAISKLDIVEYLKSRNGEKSFDGIGQSTIKSYEDILKQTFLFPEIITKKNAFPSLVTLNSLEVKENCREAKIYDPESGDMVKFRRNEGRWSMKNMTEGKASVTFAPRWDGVKPFILDDMLTALLISKTPTKKIAASAIAACREFTDKCINTPIKDSQYLIGFSKHDKGIFQNKTNGIPSVHLVSGDHKKDFDIEGFEKYSELNDILDKPNFDNIARSPYYNLKNAVEYPWADREGEFYVKKPNGDYILIEKNGDVWVGEPGKKESFLKVNGVDNVGTDTEESKTVKKEDIEKNYTRISSKVIKGSPLLEKYTPESAARALSEIYDTFELMDMSETGTSLEEEKALLVKYTLKNPQEAIKWMKKEGDIYLSHKCHKYELREIERALSGDRNKDRQKSGRERN